MSVVGVRGGPVESAIRQAAEVTGVDFDFLLRTAKRESSLNPAAKARSSSAAGLFQFVEQTWLAMVKKHGAKHGYARQAEAIGRGPDGRLRVEDAEQRRAVLDLRYDAKAASVMAGELASDHAAYLRGRVGRAPTEGELYAAHFLGPAGAAKLIEARGRTPDASAAKLFPAAAAANRTIFYEGGRSASVAEVYAELTRGGPETSTGVARVRARPAAQVATVAEATIKVVRETTTEVIRASASLRAERSRRDALLVEMVLGQASPGGLLSDSLSTELLALLANADRRSER